MSTIQTRNGQAPEPEPAEMTTADLLALVADIRVTLARIEGYLDACRPLIPLPRRSRGRRHARHGQR